MAGGAGVEKKGGKDDRMLRSVYLIRAESLE